MWAHVFRRGRRSGWLSTEISRGKVDFGVSPRGPSFSKTVWLHGLWFDVKYPNYRIGHWALFNLRQVGAVLLP